MMRENEKGTLERIRDEGKKEFLEKGYLDASLRNIVRRVGVTTGAFYGYFPDKMSLFEALVEPAASGLKQQFLDAQTEFDAFPEEVKRGAALNYSSGKLMQMIRYIYLHFDTFRLLICRAEGTDYASYVHDLAVIEVEYTVKFIESTGNDALTSGRATEEMLHILCSAFFSAVFEVVAHEMTQREAEHYIESMERFFKAGWATILFPGSN